MKNEKGIEYFLYARRSIMKSDKEEKVVSTESQMKEMKDIAQEQGLTILRTFEETITAKKPGRPQFNEMIERIKKGEANGILVWKIDRLARNPVDEGTIKYLLQEGVIKNIKATDRDWYPDDNSLLASVEFGVATQYSRDLAKHIKRGLRAKVQEGHRPSIAPLGYKNSKYREKGKETILVDEERFPIVRKIFDLALSGKHNVLEITRIANDVLGLRTKGTSRFPPGRVGKHSLYSLLGNPFYYGDFEYPLGSGIWHKGKYQPMITKQEYDEVQSVINNRGKPRKVKHEFAYRMLIKCGECGAYLTADEKFKHIRRTGEINRYVYYRCTKRVDRNCSQMPIRKEALEVQIRELLMQISIPKEFSDWAMSQLGVLAESEQATNVSVLKNHEKSLKVCEGKLGRLLDLRLADEITAEKYSSVKTDFEKERDTLKSSIQALKNPKIEELEKFKIKLSFAESLLQKFEGGDMDTRREILRNIGSNHTFKDGKLSVSIEKPLLLIGELKKQSVGDRERLEPENTFITKDIFKELTL
ncbi:recombinase family protein [Candidatus Parcubacteria bacterium]|nr:recombinase family protein [Candidatus Parcubacteria bacterium]